MSTHTHTHCKTFKNAWLELSPILKAVSYSFSYLIIYLIVIYFPIINLTIKRQKLLTIFHSVGWGQHSSDSICNVQISKNSLCAKYIPPTIIDANNMFLIHFRLDLFGFSLCLFEHNGIQSDTMKGTNARR